ncbi:MAG: TonB-dependent receptor [Chitinophagaceae bacterium]
MKKILSGIVLLAFFHAANAQKDSVKLLQSIEVRAFNLLQPAFTLPATVSVIDEETKARFGVPTLVPVMNAIAGVRMEERTPGSYRLSIRGSLLRSPFGVRNIKMYWNGLPFTDAGGNTYFNLIDRNALSGMEILKGPGGSLYGSGTGGVVLMEDKIENEGGYAAVTGGSYGSFSVGAGNVFRIGNNGFKVMAQHRQADGYREHSRMRRSNLQLQGVHEQGKWKANWLLLASDMYYQTPGGLTRAQFEADPKSARPATAVVPGAVEQKAGIYNKTVFAGVAVRYAPSAAWEHRLGLTTAYTNFKNPFITNFEEREEPGFTGRYQSVFKRSMGETVMQLEGGAEYGYLAAQVANFENNGGEKGTKMYDDRLRTWYLFPFVQGVLQWKKNWNLQAGLSYNFQGYGVKRLTETDPRFQTKNNNPQVLPRLSIQRSIAQQWSVYALLGKGFSAPSTAEVRPSDGSLRMELQPEYGWNRELGLRFRSREENVRISANVFRFGLEETIVRRIAGNGGEYFVNAGKTIQQGLELEWDAALVKGRAERNVLNWWGSVTWYDFRFLDYSSGNDDFSGNKVTGIPAHTISSGINLNVAGNWRFFLNGYHCAAIPLNDAGSERAEPYFLVQARLEKTLHLKAADIILFASGDNLLDERYSLGNDLNAVGRRYYNAAPRRSIETGVHVRW